MNEAMLLGGFFERETKGVPCECGGYADLVDDLTEEENDKHGCHIHGCCCGAFLCRICKQRIIARFEAPEFR